MCRNIRPNCIVLALCGLLLVAGTVSSHGTPAPGSQTQNAPSAGATVSVRMIDAVDSGSDSAGRQYRAIVSEPADAGNGVMISRGSPATVTLVRDSAGWVAHLSSVVINGQTIAVASNSARVTSNAENAAESAVKTMGSMLGRFGRRGSTAASIAAVASGSRVVLPPGTSLSFVLGAPPSSNPAGSAPGAGQPTPGAPQAAAAPGGPLAANVKETRLGPSQPQGKFVVSPDGGHLAVYSTHGSRDIVILDGIDGPEFDHAAHMHGEAIDVEFSPDGKRSAYLAQHGANLVAVVDGKEAYTVYALSPNDTGDNIVPTIDPAYVHVTGDQPVPHQFLISPSGAHVAVMAEEGPSWYMFLDGVKSPPYLSLDRREVAFVADKLVYAAQTTDQKWHMVVNDNPGPAYDAFGQVMPSDRHLQLSENDQHYAFIGRNGGNSVAVVDGVPGTPRPNVGSSGLHNLVIASNGRVAYLGYAGSGAHASEPSREPLFVGNQEVSPETRPFATISPATRTQIGVKVVLSPDGKRFAYAKPVPGGIAAIIDGKQSLAYDAIGVMEFSPDSRRAFFVGVKNTIDNFVVIDGQEMPGQHTVKDFVFSQNGSRFGYEGYGQLGFTMVVDGKPSGKFLNVIDNSLAFSEDGKRSVYAACAQLSHCQVVEDGKTTNVPGLYPYMTRMPPHIVFSPVLFSPDGTRLVFGYPGPNGTSIVINGQETVHGTNFSYHCFSPDSKHFAIAMWTSKGYSVFVDGKVGPAYDDLVEANANENLFRFVDAHTLRFLGVKGGQVYRVTVDLGN